MPGTWSSGTHVRLCIYTYLCGSKPPGLGSSVPAAVGNQYDGLQGLPLRPRLLSPPLSQSQHALRRLTVSLFPAGHTSYYLRTLALAAPFTCPTWPLPDLPAEQLPAQAIFSSLLT